MSFQAIFSKGHPLTVQGQSCEGMSEIEIRHLMQRQTKGQLILTYMDPVTFDIVKVLVNRGTDRRLLA